MAELRAKQDMTQTGLELCATILGRGRCTWSDLAHIMQIPELRWVRGIFSFEADPAVSVNF